MATFLADNSLAGKTVVTFATFGSGGLDSATADVAASHPDATVIMGYGVRNARIKKAPAEITRFLIESGYVEGEIAPLPEYGKTVPVTEEDIAVFDAACGDYQFPLGTPVTVANATMTAQRITASMCSRRPPTASRRHRLSMSLSRRAARRSLRGLCDSLFCQI